jgi:hypothetical protein
MANYSGAARYLGFFIAAALLLNAGCGGSDWGYLEGTVRVNGQPVGPGTITFEPTVGDKAGAVASFGEDGKYEVRSAGRKEGAAVGEYRVAIYGGGNFGEEVSGPRPPSKIPPRYGDPATSDLTATIEPGTKTVDFDLQP